MPDKIEELERRVRELEEWKENLLQNLDYEINSRNYSEPSVEDDVLYILKRLLD